MRDLRQSFPASSAGFTLIELVIVITILGILAAVALPKFASLQTDSRIAKLNAARGAVGAGAAIVHAAYLSRGGVTDVAVCPGTAVNATNLVNGTVCVEGGVITMANGYPSGAIAMGNAAAGIITAAGLYPSITSTPTLAQLNIEGIGASVAAGPPGVTTISVIGGSGTAAGVNATCSFTYTSPTVAGAAPVISAVTTTGC